MRLYELSAAYRMLSEMEDAEAFDAALSELQGNIEEKAENIAALVRSLEAETEAHRTEAKRHAEIAQARQNRTDRLKDYLKTNLEGAGLTRVKAGLFSVAIQANGGRPVVRIAPDAELPEAFTVLVPEVVTPEHREPDYAALVAAWEVKQELPAGVEIGRGTHLRIR